MLIRVIGNYWKRLGCRRVSSSDYRRLTTLALLQEQDHVWMWPRLHGLITCDLAYQPPVCPTLPFPYRSTSSGEPYWLYWYILSLHTILGSALTRKSTRLGCNSRPKLKVCDCSYMQNLHLYTSFYWIRPIRERETYVYPSIFRNSIPCVLMGFAWQRTKCTFHFENLQPETIIGTILLGP